jgi:hypothetical protein
LFGKKFKKYFIICIRQELCLQTLKKLNRLPFKNRGKITMNKAEDFKTVEDLNVAINADLPAVVFTKWLELGGIVENLDKKERRLKNNTLPTNKRGLYILGVKPDGSDNIYMIYLGVACGEKSGGVRNRVRNHFSYSQNDTLGSESGPLACARAINMKGQYYACFYECNDAELCDRYESVILFKYDFICNVGKKQVRVRRIPDLIKLCCGGVESSDSDVEGADDKATNVGPPSVGPPSVGPPSVGPPSVGPPSVGPPSVGPPSVGPPSVSEAANIREKVLGLPAKKRRRVQKNTAVSTPVLPSVANISSTYAVCGCGKTFKASANLLSISCNCGCIFTFAQ